MGQKSRKKRNAQARTVSFGKSRKKVRNLYFTGGGAECAE